MDRRAGLHVSRVLLLLGVALGYLFRGSGVGLRAGRFSAETQQGTAHAAPQDAQTQAALAQAVAPFSMR